MRVRFLSVIALLVLLSFGTSQQACAKQTRVGAWLCCESTDAMTGTTSYFIGTESVAPLNGWVKKGPLFLGYQNGRFYLYADDMGFDFELTCDEYGCTKYQMCRVKVDDGDLKRFKFHLWEKTTDGMRIVASDYQKKELVRQMKAGNQLLVEVCLSLTKGRRQVARFDLSGFTKAINWLQKNSQ